MGLMDNFDHQFMAFHDKSIGLSWIHLIANVSALGGEVPDTQQGAIFELLSPQVVIPTATFPDPIIESLGSAEAIDSMRKNFFKSEPFLDWGYSYNERIFAKEGIDQIQWVVTRLRRDVFTKSATISLLDPKAKGDHIPCVALIDFKIRSGSLCIHSFLRSSDVVKKFYADAACILEIGRMVAGQINISDIDMIFSIASAHIYLKDAKAAHRILLSAQEMVPFSVIDGLCRLQTLLDP